MTRILLVATASPRRVRRVAETSLAAADSRPEITIASDGDRATLDYFREIPGIRVVALADRGTLRTLCELRGERFDMVRIFWTGERKYRRLKLASLVLGRRATLVDNGDGGLFRLTPDAVVRHAEFRRQHPFPHDHWELVPPEVDDPLERRHPGERVLVLQSAEPSVVVRGLERMAANPVFHNPRYTVFSRNRREALARFSSHALVAEVRIHDESRGSLRHLIELRRARFDGLVLFLTGDPSYWKIKYFAFLLGTRHKLVFNENNDCFTFSWRRWLALVTHRLRERRGVPETPRWLEQAGIILFLFLKTALVPLRFLWLLAVWLRLRSLG